MALRLGDVVLAQRLALADRQFAANDSFASVLVSEQHNAADSLLSSQFNAELNVNLVLFAQWRRAPIHRCSN